jgi:membrane-bound hydrogenase subunit beta
MTDQFLSVEEVAERIRAACGEGIRDVRIDDWHEGASKVLSRSLWIRVDRDRFRTAVQQLLPIHYPHLGVISGNDIGEHVELLYHFFIYYGHRHRQILVTLAVPVPKTDPTIPTITDLIPGALTSEREKQEMLGVTVTGIPDGRRLFLDDDFPAGIYPWRKDATGIPESMVKQLWATGRKGAVGSEPAATENPS